jgi:hypothetical protein
MYVEAVHGSFKEQTIDIDSNHCWVEVMRRTVYVRTERARKTRLHITRVTVRLKTEIDMKYI